MELVFVAASGLVILATMFAVYVVYEKHSLDAHQKPRSFVLYVLGAMLSGFLASGLVIRLVMDEVCSEHAGALCAFGVTILTQPFSFCVGIGIFVYLWVKVKGHPTGELKKDE